MNNYVPTSHLICYYIFKEFSLYAMILKNGISELDHTIKKHSSNLYLM